MATTAEVLKNIGGWTFDFFSSDDSDSQKTATYSLLLDVTEDCTWERNKVIDIPEEKGFFELIQNPDDIIIAAIEKEKELLAAGSDDDDEEGD